MYKSLQIKINYSTLLFLLICFQFYAQSPPVLDAGVTNRQAFCKGNIINIAPSFTITPYPTDAGIDVFFIQISSGYQVNSDQLELTGSIVDLGFIKHKKNIKNSFINGSYNFEGIEFGYDEANSTNYWGDLDQDFKEKVPSGDNQESYISWRPTKFNASLKYSFGEKRSQYCYDNTYKDFYVNSLGVQLYSVFRPLGPQIALTGFFEKSLSKKIRTKVTYTIDDYSFYNIGAGISAQIGKVNFYGMVDNIAQFSDIAAANNISLQLGINVIFN